MTTVDLRQGSCIELLKTIPDKSIDMFLCDLPYGETNCKWDTCIDMEEFWNEFKRVRKSVNTPCIHFCSSRFGYSLIKSWEKGFKMDLVWKKRNKTGGLQSRLRPMRNHEMVYFFYEKSPKYNRDKYHKRIVKTPTAPKKTSDKTYNAKGKSGHGYDSTASGAQVPHFDPKLPTSVQEATEKNKQWGYNKSGAFTMDAHNNQVFDPKLPCSVQEENYMEKGMDSIKACDAFKKKLVHAEPGSKYKKEYYDASPWHPPHPSSVLEEESKGWSQMNDSAGNKQMGSAGPNWEPQLPESVQEIGEEYYKNVPNTFSNKAWKGQSTDWKINTFGAKYDPSLPVSIMEGCDDAFLDVFDYIENPEDAPESVYNSKKCFIGKRNHQTEKPIDILEFLIKYWTDEGWTILDPTMGSGSTGVAAKKLGRNFIGFELDETIFKTAEKRIADGK